MSRHREHFQRLQRRQRCVERSMHRPSLDVDPEAATWLTVAESGPLQRAPIELHEDELEAGLVHGIRRWADDAGLRDVVVATYRDAGVLTYDHGIVLRIGGSMEFRLRIARVQ